MFDIYLLDQLTTKHPHGSPENILSFGSEDEFKIDIENLKDILQHPKVKDRKIVAFSVIGAFRRGKSYFLNYCLRYLYAHVSIKRYLNKASIAPPKNIWDII